MTDVPSDPCPDLAEARAALDAADGERALLALLRAWRATRAPRIADLVERVAVDVTAEHPFPKAKSVKERTAAMLTVLGRRSPAELGGAVAQPWPGKWQDAEPVLQAFCAVSPDPRVAMLLARTIDTGPYDTYTTDPFWQRLLTRVESLADPRTVPLLESAQARPRSTYFRDIKVAIGRTIEALRAKAPPPLSDEATAHLAALEAHFASDVQRAAAKQRGEAELLAAIRAAPDDLTLRQVFGDFLAERGDPRGEHIALGLARREGRADPSAARKEAALAKKHGAQWIGDLDRVLAKDGRGFDCGFLEAASLELVSRRDYRSAKELPAAMHDPAFSTVRTLDFGRSGVKSDLFVEILALPALAHLTGLAGISDADLAALGDLPPRPRIRALDAVAVGERARKVLVDGVVFPGLVDLTVEGGGDLAWLLASPAARRLERLAVRDYDWPLGVVRGAVEAAGLSLRELVFAERRYGEGWRWALTADAEGRYSELRGRSAGPSSVPSSFDFERALQQVPDDSLTVLEVPDHDVCRWDSGDIGRAERQLERFPRARIRVPWRRPPKVEARPGRPVRFAVYGKDLVGPRLAAVLDVVTAPPFSLVLDCYAEDHKNHLAVEGPIPALAAKVFAKKRAPWCLHLYREGARESSHLEVSRSNASLEVTSVVEDTPEARRSHHEGLVRLLDQLGEVERGVVAFADRLRSGRAGRRATIPCRPLWHLDLLGHVNAFGPGWLELFPVDELRTLVGRPGLPEVTVVPAARSALLVLGRDPDDIPDDDAIAALELALAEILDRTYPRVRGYRLSDAVLEGLADALAADGYVAADEDRVRTLIGDRKLRSPSAPALEVELLHRLAETKLRVRLDGTYLRHDGAMDFAARDRAELDVSIARIRAILAEHRAARLRP